ncbi:MAG: DNA adenine methylase [Prevotellaceae bacterium]|jgi:DNA adenine methylase|nr:DNA adenine methylase [Prevotellaceae bacterium]
MKLPHPIPYQGSKRNLAGKILRYFPAAFDRLIEPFAGSAAISIASAFYFKANHFVLNDVNQPLMSLWDSIINSPQHIAKQYYDIWNGQHGNEEDYYYAIRDKFNETQRADYLLFLLAKCVKAAVRYNAQGNFNQSPDKRRLGRNPQLMRDAILGVSQLLSGKTEIYSADYSIILNNATPNDLVYMDPPYQGTGQNGGFSYAGSIDFEDFIIALFELNKKNVPYILSFDGRTGDKPFGNPLPDKLHLTKIEINAGRSTQATLLNRKEYTYEALYLSPSLVERIDMSKKAAKQYVQHELFALHE